jgi:hypothetical protein
MALPPDVELDQPGKAETGSGGSSLPVSAERIETLIPSVCAAARPSAVWLSRS